MRSFRTKVGIILFVQMITSFAILLVSMLFCLAALAAEVLWSKKAREKGRSRPQGVVAPFCCILT